MFSLLLEGHPQARKIRLLEEFFDCVVPIRFCPETRQIDAESAQISASQGVGDDS
jgi:hypothetical protein